MYPTPELPGSQFIPSILHFSGQEPYTKYEMCLVFAKILEVAHDHIVSDSNPPQGDAAASRPANTRLDVIETEKVVGPLECCAFEEWWEEHLRGKASGEQS